MRIMRIEDEIKRVRKSKRFRQINLNITKLKARSGNAIIEVEDPDTQKKVQVRRNSDQSKEILARYQHQLDEYDTLINELGKKKKNLTTELFE